MSVMKFSVKTFADVTTSVLHNDDLRRKFLLDEEIGELALLNLYPIDDSELDKKILCFVERLYIANTLAFDYQYSEMEEITIKRLERNDLDGSLIINTVLLLNLRSIKYNLYTNNGHCFTSEKDIKRLDRFIETLENLIKIGVS